MKKFEIPIPDGMVANIIDGKVIFDNIADVEIKDSIESSKFKVGDLVFAEGIHDEKYNITGRSSIFKITKVDNEFYYCDLKVITSDNNKISFNNNKHHLYKYNLHKLHLATLNQTLVYCDTLRRWFNNMMKQFKSGDIIYAKSINADTKADMIFMLESYSDIDFVAYASCEYNVSREGLCTDRTLDGYLRFSYDELYTYSIANDEQKQTLSKALCGYMEKI